MKTKKHQTNTNEMRASLVLSGVALVLALGLLFSYHPQTALSQASSGPITGYGWSETIGWIDFNCSNTGVCGTSNYGLAIDTSGNISGYAWSENVGWISANSADLSGCPSAPCTATISTTTQKLSGWMKAIGADNNGWDGWISLSGTSPYAYGPVLSNGSFSGSAWGSDNIGWIDFSYASTTWIACSSGYSCVGNAQYYTNAQCVTALQQTCSYLCSSGACVQAPVASGSITAHPSLVHAGATSTIAWSTTNATYCTVTGTNTDSWTGTSGSKTSSGIVQNTVYTLQCSTAALATSTIGTATVTLVPTWQEPNKAMF